ncbi:MAG: cytochrome c biogenesis protein CcsA [Sedimentisphaerales bacterium]
MAFKWTIQGLLIYAMIAAYFFAFVATLLHQRKTRKTGTVTYFLGFLIGCAAIAYRWVNVSHIPMQNLFEVFLVLGVLVYPISIFCERVLRIGGVAGDMLIGIIVLFPAGFIFNAEPRQLPPALQSWLFGPHVFVYMLSYVIMAKAAIQAGLQLLWKGVALEAPNFMLGVNPQDKPGGLPDPTSVPHLLSPEEATYQTIRLGFPLLTLGLALGSVWGQQAWGDWWGWDPKELWSLASWLVYVGYLHFRYMFGRRFSRINSLWAVVGLAVIIITLLWVNLSRLFPGMHSYAM